MAKPAKVKKDKDSASSGNGARAKAGTVGGKAKAVGGKAKAAPAEKGKGKARARKQQAAPGGLKGRLSRSQAKAQPAKGKAAAKPQGNRAVKFLREVRVELSKVTWPTREELIQSTVAVVIAVAIVGAYIAFFDFVFNRIITYFSGG